MTALFDSPEMMLSSRPLALLATTATVGGRVIPIVGELLFTARADHDGVILGLSTSTAGEARTSRRGRRSRDLGTKPFGPGRLCRACDVYIVQGVKTVKQATEASSQPSRVHDVRKSVADVNSEQSISRRWKLIVRVNREGNNVVGPRSTGLLSFGGITGEVDEFGHVGSGEGAVASGESGGRRCTLRGSSGV